LLITSGKIINLEDSDSDSDGEESCGSSDSDREDIEESESDILANTKSKGVVSVQKGSRYNPIEIDLKKELNTFEIHRCP